MTKLWNFIMDNKLITVSGINKTIAEEKARKIYEELKQNAS